MSVKNSLQQWRQSSLRKWSRYISVASESATPVGKRNRLKSASSASVNMLSAFVNSSDSTASNKVSDKYSAKSANNLSNNINTDAGLIEQSWNLSASNKVSIANTTAPVGDPDETWKEFHDSRLYNLISLPVRELGRIAGECNFAVCVSDSSATLQWALHSKSFESHLEQMHFVPSAKWSEADIGTNAVGLAARLGKPVTVFAAEHYVPNLHSWVCYAAPVIHPATGRVIAVIDISGSWQDAHPMAMQTVISFALDISQTLHNETIVTPEHSYALELCGHRTGLWLNREQLSPRLQEIVLILACHPQGLDLHQLHAHLYGDLSTSISTLKSELTHLRRKVGDVLLSKPYRLQWPGKFITDLHLIEHYALSCKAKALASIYLRQPLVHSRSPAVEEYCRYLHQLVVTALCKSRDVDALWQFSQHHEDEFSVLECLKKCLPAGDNRHLAIDSKLACCDY